MDKSNEINRRSFVRKSISALAGLSLATTFPAWAWNRKSKKPLNILFLMCDQYRPDALRTYGDINAITPTLDNLAASGISLRQSYCQSPVSVASRNSFLNGCYTHSNGVISNAYSGNRQMLSYTQMLRKHGYTTACFGKLHTPGREDLDWDIYNEGINRPVGKKREDGVKLSGTANIISDPTIGAPDPYPMTDTMEWHAKENTIKFMCEHTDTPWLIQCSFLKPHAPYQPPQEYWDMIDRSKLIIPNVPANDLDDCDPRYYDILKGRGMQNLTREQILDGMQGYYGNIAFSDAMFREVLDELDRLNLRENTLIVFTADHGEMLNDHGLWTKFVFFDPSVRVPLIMSLPGVIPAGRESTALVELIDLFPTFTELTGYETPSTVQGASLVPLITGQTDTHKSVVYSEYPLPRKNVGGGDFYATMMMFDGRFKLIDNGPDSFPELYDHANDKGEFNNIAGEPSKAERVKKKLAELRAWHKKDAVKNQPTVAQMRRNTDSSKE
jgi:choline-sulfatase